MQSISEIIRANNKGRVGDWITWTEFRGKKNERRCEGRIKEVREDGYLVEHTMPVMTHVHPEKIVDIRGR